MDTLKVTSKLIKKIRRGEDFSAANLKNCRKVLEAANVQYISTGKTFLTDEEFDALRAEYNLYDTAIPLNLSVQATGKKVEHTNSNLLGSLDNVFDCDQLTDWVSKRANVGVPVPKGAVLIASFKYDGCSVAFDVGKEDDIIKAYSRGQDGIGEDFTHIFEGWKYMSDEGCTNKCECIMLWDDFEEYSKLYAEENGRALANPRTAVAGILGSNDGAKYAKFLTLVPLDFVHSGSEKFSRLERLSQMASSAECSNGFMPMEYATLKWNGKKLYWEFEGKRHPVSDLYEQVIDDRNSDTFGYMIDGIVVELASEATRTSLGFKESDGKPVPKWAVALKFPYKSAITRIKEFQFDVAGSRSGRITPVVMIDPVTIDGKEYSRVSLSNFSRVMKEDLRHGEEVELTIRGDVLGYVARPEGREVNTDQPKVQIPNSCPVCEGDVEFNESGAWLFCQNSECMSKATGWVLNYLRRMRIKGIAEETVQKLYDEGWLDDGPTCLYDISNNEEEIALIEGLGPRSVADMVEAIDARREPWDYEVVGSMGWTGLGRSMMKRVFQEMTWADLTTMFNTSSKTEFVETAKGFKDFGKGRAQKLYECCRDQGAYVDALFGELDVRLWSREDHSIPEKSLTFVITGDLHRWDRDDLKIELTQMGHRLTSSVSGKTDYLVTNFPDSGTTKITKARSLGKPVISEEEFMNLLGLGPAENVKIGSDVSDVPF